MKKKILILSRSFYPTNSPRSFRSTELAKAFAKQGHQVTVLTPKDESIHAEFEKKHNIRIKDLGKPKWKAQEIKGNRVIKLWTRAVRRFSKLWLEYPDIELLNMVKNALKKESGYDLLISIAVPHPVHWGVARIWDKQKKTIAKTWVADCGDPFMGSENDSFKSPFYFKYVEKWCFNKVDYITVPTAGAIPAYYPEFHSKIKVIPQGFDFHEFPLYPGPIEHKVPTFAYAGIFIPGRRDPKEFLSHLLGQQVEFKFYIYTKNRELVASFESKSKGKIVVLDYIPREELLYELSKMDFLVNFENAGPRQKPSKLIDYLIVKKPVLSIKTGALNKELVDEFLIGNYTNQLKIENPEQYKIENVAQAFTSLLN
ncbi:glycosyltransferase [Pararhodonellum marinum]|uniref:glycosyltransferase n=1 Tax=Pararhodonellum marinum TaxID=2755358 RepID=UPI00188E9B8A|nr:glycosyltransferase [Pararhodonellum marinum]